MLELTHLEREVVNAVEVHDVVLVHQGDGDGHHDVLQSEKNWLKFLCSRRSGSRRGRRRRNCIIQEFVAREESDRGKRLSGVVSRLRGERKVIWSLRDRGKAYREKKTVPLKDVPN